MTEMLVDRLVLDGFIKDAARYRWLRDSKNEIPTLAMVIGGFELDAAIDAAMKAENEPKEN